MGSLKNSTSSLWRPLSARCSCNGNLSSGALWLDQTRTHTSNGDQDLAQRHAAKKADLERKKAAYEDKYAERLQQKVQECDPAFISLAAQADLKAYRAGLKSLEQLRVKRMLAAAAVKANKSPPARQTPVPSSSVNPVEEPKAGPSNERSPIKALGSIIDLDKISKDKLNREQIGQLWTAYHSLKTSYLSAVIPVPTYRRMLATAALYPEFVVPLARGSDGESVELWLLQWSRPSPSASTVLFTPMAAYHARGTYAAPALILTHYTDLVDSHGVALMRGERTEEAQHLLTADDAKMLVWRLQRFYNTVENETSADGKKHRALLEDFHRPRRPGQEYDIQQLVKIAHEV